MKICKICGGRLDDNDKNDICNQCKKKRRKTVLIGCGSFCTSLAVTTLYLHKHPEKAVRITDFCSKNVAWIKDKIFGVKSLSKRDLIPDAIPVNSAESSQKLLPEYNYANLFEPTKIDLLIIEMANEAGVKIYFKKDFIDYSTVNSRLKDHELENIIDAFPDWKEHVKDVPKGTLQKIISDASTYTSRVESAELISNKIHLKVRTHKGNIRYNVIEFFDEDFNMLDGFLKWTDYPSEKVSEIYIDNLLRILKKYIENEIIDLEKG